MTVEQLLQQISAVEQEIDNLFILLRNADDKENISNMIVDKMNECRRLSERLDEYIRQMR